MRAKLKAAVRTCSSTQRPTARTRRFACAFALVAIAAAMGASAASAQRPARPHMASHFIRKTVNASGTYEVVVSLRARGKHERKVRVYLGGAPMRKAVALPWWGSRLRYRLHLSTSALIVRVVNAPPAVAVRVSMKAENPASPASGTKPKQLQATAPSSGPTGASGAPQTSAPASPPAAPAPAPPAPALAANPYTNLMWEDNFAQDFVNGGSVANQLPNPANWSLDSWSGCGQGTLSTPTPNGSPNADKNVYLTANGLAITALQTGTDTYSSAQLDSIGPQSNPEAFSSGGTIEASIELPAGQGLCPAFWMLAENPAAGATTPGEIDILEAPSFGPLPSTDYFDLHGPTGAEEFETTATPAGWNPTQFHTYGVIWTPTSITWTIDGVGYATATQGSVPAASWASYETGAFRLIFDLSVGGWACSAGACAPPASATMYVQWVKVFN
jgi:beta-glucanase (GH16 family)